MDQRIFKRLAQAAVFTPKVGNAVNTRVMVGTLEMVEGYDVEVVDGGALLTALRADVGKPKRGDQFLIDERYWVVERVEYSTDPSAIQLVCKERLP